MRIIDAHRLLEELNEAQIEGNELYKGLGAAKVMVCYQPTVDAVPVVRCKECKHFWAEDKACGIYYSVTTENDYCSAGERRTKMGEAMPFPETWEEFEKVYGFTDTDEVYTNGARLIPSFRVEQWLEHLESERKRKEQEEEDDKIYCPYYTTRTETRYLSDAQMCKVYEFTGKVMRSAEQRIGYCMGTKNMIECHCDGLKERCEHK